MKSTPAILQALVLACLLPSVHASPALKKCTIDGRTVYSDTLCVAQGTGIDSTNATPPTPADRRAAEHRNTVARLEEARKEARRASKAREVAFCDARLKNTLTTIELAQKYPKNLQLQSRAKTERVQLELECPNHLIMDR